MSWELPKGWIWSTIGEVCHNPQYGWTTKASKIGSLQLVRTTDITSGTINWDTVPFCDKEPEDKEKYLLKDGDIIISRAGSVGYSLLIKSPQHSVFASYLIRFLPLIDGNFIAYFLKSPYYWNSISESKIGIAVPNVNATKLKQVSIPIAPLNEQHRIVAKIEELFTKLDAGVEALKKVQSQLKRYRQSVLKAAVEGRLTTEWREQHLDELEPADKLLERIQKKRKERLGKKYKDPMPVDTSNMPELPEGWIWSSIEQISINHDGQRIPVKAKDRAEMQGDYPYYGASGIIDYVNDYLFEGEYLLIAEDGANLLSRSTPIAFVAEGKFWVNNHAHIIQAYGNVPLKFLELFFNSFDLKFYITGTAQPKLTQSSLNKIPVPLPPLDEQQQIREEVERIFSVIEESNFLIETELKRAQSLRQSILKRVFEGKLVPQDPNDLPAPVLLERIKAEKAKSKKSKQLEMS